jgi:ankyrin repeat protein
MPTRVDCATITPEEFAAQICDWLRLVEQRGKPTPDMIEASQAVAQTMWAADEAGRDELFIALAEKDGATALRFSAKHGVTGAIRRLAMSGVSVDETTKSSSGFTPLILAAQNGHADAVSVLLDCGADPMAMALGANALAVALLKSHQAVVDVLLARVRDLSGLKYMRGTLLHLAAEQNRPDIVPLLVQRGVSPNEPDNLNVTPLAVAAERGHLEVVKALLDAGASTELPPPPPGEKQWDSMFRLKDTPLIHAAKNGNEAIVRLLTDAGAKVEIRGQQEMTALDWAKQFWNANIVAILKQKAGLSGDALDGMDLIQAAKAGDVETIRRALAIGADVDCRDKPTQGEYKTIPGRTALMHAAIQGHVEAARLLLEAGASLSVKEDGGMEATALEVAARHDQPEILALMIERLPKRDDKLLGRAIVEAAAAGALEAVRFLLDAGVKVDARGSERQTALIAAAGSGRDAVVKLLLERGAKVDLKSAGMFAGTALHTAITNLFIRYAQLDADGNRITAHRGDSKACIRILLAAGADPNSLRKDGEAPLRAAAAVPEVVAILLDAGANPNEIARRDGTTALHWASMQRAVASVQALLAAGAIPTVVDEEGRTPLDVARERKYDEIVELLCLAGAKGSDETAEGVAAKLSIAERERQDNARHVAAAVADERIRPDFSAAIKSDKFQQAVGKLEKLCGQPCRRADHLPALAYGTVQLKQANELWDAEFEAFQQRGCYLFRCGRAILEDDDELLAILPTTDQFEVVAAMGTNGANYELYTSDIVNGLHTIYEMTPFRIAKVAHDTIDGHFTEQVANPKAMAKLMYELCPDIVDQGVGTVRKLEQSLKKDRRLFFWWD